MGKYCITQDLANYKSDTQISQNCLKKTYFSAAKMLHRLLQPVSRETFLSLLTALQRYLLLFFAVYFLFFSITREVFLQCKIQRVMCKKFPLAMSLVIGRNRNGNYQRIVDCRRFFPSEPSEKNIAMRYMEVNTLSNEQEVIIPLPYFISN